MARIDVTEEHIKLGQPCESADCPVALAILEVLRADLRVKVSSATIRVLDRDSSFTWWDTWAVPDDARNFMTGFDLGLTRSPFSFELNIPQELLRG